MSDVYAIRAEVHFYVLADSEQEAQEIADRELDEAANHLPPRVSFQIFQPYRTPNQAAYMRRDAANLADERSLT